MAVYLVRTCARYSSMRSLSTHFIKPNQIFKQHSTVSPLFMPCVQCADYHTTFAYLKKRKASDEPKAPSFVPKKTKTNLPTIEIWNYMTVSELADSAHRSIDDILDALHFSDPSTHYKTNSVIENSRVLYDVVKKLGARSKLKKKTILVELEEVDHDVHKRPPPDESVLIKRRPVVTIMGHVDHGKTTLLDTLRHTSVVSTEFGGITQHIGAFNVTLDTGEMITFLDTPGHAAFSAMRARGAKATDIVVLVVAADDGVMEQTVQSIEMANAENVPIIVAINKIDKPEANIERTQQMLAAKGIVVESLGGEVQSVNISALKNINLNNLVDAIMLQADLLNLKGDPTGLVEGIIIESSVDVSRGKLATILVQRGTLRKGAFVVSGLAWGKVRSMFDHSGKPVVQANLSDAVQVIGWKTLPTVGEELLEVPNEKIARMVMRFRESREASKIAEEHQKEADKKHQQYLEVYKKELEERRSLGRYRKRSTVVPKASRNPEDDIPKVNVIIKGDVLGSVEAILDIFETYTEDERCRLSVVHYGIGQITENDVELAEAFQAVIYAFNTSVPDKIKEEIKNKKITIRPHKVIYSLIDDVRSEINQKLPEMTMEEILGEATVLQEFEITEGKKKVKVAGCRCTKGALKKSEMYHLIRNGETIYTGKLSSMKHLKTEVDTIKADKECGLKLKDPTISFQPGDVLVCFKTFKQKSEIEWNPGF